MSAGTGGDFLREWLERHRLLLDSRAGPLWQQCERVYQAWAGAAEAFASAHAARHGGPDASPFDPAGWLRPAGAGGLADMFRWLEGQGLPGGPTLPGEWLRGTRQWSAYLAATEQMKAVLAEGWLTAFRTFLEHAVAEDRAGEAPGWERLVTIWRDTAAAEMARTHRRGAFLAAQRDLVRTETELRQYLRGQVERVAGELGLPTRAELDDIHERLHALSREMRRSRARESAGRGGT